MGPGRYGQTGQTHKILFHENTIIPTRIFFHIL